MWSFGNEVYAILRELLFLRERLRPYIHHHMTVASETGLPLMRPLFVDFPVDGKCETIEDQFMFGSDILVAPVLWEGARDRRVYLPDGTDWTTTNNNATYSGGQWIDVAAPLETIPIFLKAGSDLQDMFRTKSA